MKLSRILVPTDFSASSDNALRAAVSLAAMGHGSLALLHVAPFPVPFASDFYGPMPIVDFQPTVEQLGKESNRLIEQLAAREVPPEVAWTPRVVLGSPAEEILREIEQGYDLVVMGTHGRTGLGHLLLGSVAERVLRHSKVPVLVTR